MMLVPKRGFLILNYMQSALNYKAHYLYSLLFFSPDPNLIYASNDRARANP